MADTEYYYAKVQGKIVFLLDDDDKSFPDPLSVPMKDRLPDGLFAVGGDLSPERLVEAYSQGIFPWAAFRLNELHWYCPMERFVIFPEEIHVSHSMRTLLNKGKYTVTMDTCFRDVINHCSQLRIEEEGAWLGPQMVEAYAKLHDRGVTHSVEVWDMYGRLAGGLYGVYLNGGFFGESMFSLVPSASKIALIHLAEYLKEHGGKLIDCQFETPHLKSMGGRHISYEEYMDILWT